MILGTAGHIDHGKTTLVKALTGVDTDRLPEEKRRGITIDLGFAPLQLEGVGTVGVVDVPGHEAFVRTMVAGATGIDMALLVIAADEGIMPQTREHVAILEHLAVPRGVVALTKRDMVEEDWLDLVRADVIALLAETRLANAPVVPVSATTGDGITELRAALISVARDVPEKQVNDLFRLPIDRVFTVKGTGTVVTGTVWSGELADGATIRLLPQGREVRVRGLQNHSRSVPSIRLRADVVLTDAVGPRTRVRFHVGTSEVGARLHVITSAGPPVITSAGPPVITSAARDPLSSAAEPQPARITLDAPVVLRAGDRFVLRRSSPLETIGGGAVTDPLPPKRAKPWPVGLDVKERYESRFGSSWPSIIARARSTRERR